ncbi:MAG: thioredoxin fold domain-containing protein, partial [Pseudomonadota bacterium]
NDPSILAALAMSTALTALAVSPSNAQPQQPVTPDQSVIAKAEAQMGVTFSNMSIVDFRESPIDGLYQADIGGRIVYYYPDDQDGDGVPEDSMLIFGQIFNQAGVDLTSLALQETQAKRQELVDLDKALVLGPPDAPAIVEFSNPDCGYCRSLNRFLESEAEQGHPVRRKIIFSAWSAASLKKVEHILCAEDQEASFNEVYGGVQPETLTTCPEGKALAEAHAHMSRSVGIQGTPTLWLDGRSVEGFRQAELVAFLQAKRAN